MSQRNESPFSEKCTHSSKKLPTLVEIKAAIPSHLFKSNILLSFYYMTKDMLFIWSLYLGMRVVEARLPSCMTYTVFPVYWYLQGTLLMGLFVLGHDCGHGSFSRFERVNDAVGTFLHTLVMTPYFPWKLSHKNHHKHTGNIDKDEVFYPVRNKHFNGTSFVFLFGLGIGWFAYLIRGYHPRKISHINPKERMFSNHVIGCVVSLLTLVVWLYFLYIYACAFGFVGLLKYYVIPEVVFGSWLLIVTFLHHIEEDTPWYSDENWNNVKGPLSSIDRQYGWAHDVIHNIGTHQIHHLFSMIPHYNLEEATRHFRYSFPDLVRKRDDPIMSSAVRMFRKFSKQHVIDDDVGIHVYK